MQEATRDEILDACQPNSDQINYDDLAISGPTVYTVAGVYRVEGSKEIRIRLVGEKRYYKPSKNQLRMLKLAWGADEPWIGKSMELFGEPTVPFKGVPVGGIEIKRVSGISTAISANLTAGNRKKKTFTVYPLVTQSAGSPSPSTPADSPEGGYPAPAADPPGAPDYAVEWIKGETKLSEWIGTVRNFLDTAEDPFEAWQDNLTTFTALTNAVKDEKAQGALQALQDHAKAKIEAVKQADLLSAG